MPNHADRVRRNYPALDAEHLVCTSHKTVPVMVRVDIDEGIAGLVRRLNEIEDVRTYASCQGTDRYAPYVMVGWTTLGGLRRLKDEFNFRQENEAFGYVSPA